MNLEERIEQLEKQKKILQDSIRNFKKRAEEAEGEVTIVKGIGMNSPEMKLAKQRIEELEEINRQHQKLNGELQTRLTEVEEDNKKLSFQIEDQVNKFRSSGM